MELKKNNKKTGSYPVSTLDPRKNVSGKKVEKVDSFFLNVLENLARERNGRKRVFEGEFKYYYNIANFLERRRDHCYIYIYIDSIKRCETIKRVIYIACSWIKRKTSFFFSSGKSQLINYHKNRDYPFPPSYNHAVTILWHFNPPVICVRSTTTTFRSSTFISSVTNGFDPTGKEGQTGKQEYFIPEINEIYLISRSINLIFIEKSVQPSL